MNEIQNQTATETQTENQTEKKAELIVIPSKYSVQAGALEKTWEGTQYPGPLPRFYVDLGNGHVQEYIRGFDVCLVHSPGDPALGCSDKVRSRGLCESDLARLNYRISHGKVSEAANEAQHRILASTKKRRASVVSLDDYLLSA